MSIAEWTSDERLAQIKISVLLSGDVEAAVTILWADCSPRELICVKREWTSKAGEEWALEPASCDFGPLLLLLPGTPPIVSLWSFHGPREHMRYEIRLWVSVDYDVTGFVLMELSTLGGQVNSKQVLKNKWINLDVDEYYEIIFKIIKKYTKTGI